MKTAIYIEDGIVQLVITPESDFEKNALTTLSNKKIDANLFNGSFYDCRGGWVRQTAVINQDPQFYSGRKEDQSLILRVNETINLNIND
jgi:hypothetical protein